LLEALPVVKASAVRVGGWREWTDGATLLAAGVTLSRFGVALLAAGVTLSRFGVALLAAG
jgi:hypothetical protein